MDLYAEGGVDGGGGEGGGCDTSEGDCDSRESSAGPWTTTDTLDWGTSPSALSVCTLEDWHIDKKLLNLTILVHIYTAFHYTNNWKLVIVCEWCTTYTTPLVLVQNSN